MKATIDMVTVMRDVTMEVKYRRMGACKIRLWLALRLIRLATWITGMGLKIEND